MAPLAERCAELGRWEFLFTMAPLRIPQGHGLPGQSGGRPVSAPTVPAGVRATTRSCGALVQRYARAADDRDVEALAALFHPRPR